MALTYINLASTTLSADTAAVTFSNIPQTYTDLVVYMSTRISGEASNGINAIFPRPNDATPTSLYYQVFQNSVSNLALASNAQGFTSNAQATVNIYGPAEIYIFDYTSTTNQKPFFFISHSENNSSSDWALAVTAARHTTNTAITSLTFRNETNNYLAGSTFYLYGVKNN